MNQASSRSHCMFTVHVTSKESGAETVRRSKLHLVDLAGYLHSITIQIITSISDRSISFRFLSF